MLSDPHYRARQYPYHIPERSFVMTNGDHVVVGHDDHLDDLDGRRPVLAVGSNMSPQQLARKFPPPEGGTIPVTKIRLLHFDTVYSTHFTGYGSIPATLHPSPDTEVMLFVTWLDAAQERHMHTTEIAGENYHFCRLDNIQARVENGPDLDHLYFYQSSRGALPVDGNPVPLAEVEASNRRWVARSQDEIQEYARQELAPHLDFAAFIEDNIENDQNRQQRTDALHVTALTFHYEATTKIAV
ncbi:MAG: hypothetical protein HQ501_03720 [Rhodospirillales bacterium]|nr:hypothetical protein [Rhodospirillales bacterium]